MSRPPRLVALDLGGVLADVDRSALARTLARPQAEVEAAFFAHDRHRRLVTGRLSLDAFLAETAAALGPENDPGLRGVEIAWAAMVSLRPGARTLVEALRERVDVGVWTNTDPLHYRTLLAGLGPALEPGGPHAVSFALGVQKPDPAFFAAALAKAGLPASEVVFLDDREENIDAARAAGIDGIRTTRLDEAWQSLSALGAVAVDRAPT